MVSDGDDGIESGVSILWRERSYLRQQLIRKHHLANENDVAISAYVITFIMAAIGYRLVAKAVVAMPIGGGYDEEIARSEKSADMKMMKYRLGWRRR